jgi:hypothetical protein
VFVGVGVKYTYRLYMSTTDNCIFERAAAYRGLWFCLGHKKTGSRGAGWGRD